MVSKLILSIDSKVIESARKYAKRKGLSISKIVEEHLSQVTKSKKESDKQKSLESLAKLKGIAGPFPPDYDYKELIADAILEKHLK